jgi:hypothetical protein
LKVITGQTLLYLVQVVVKVQQMLETKIEIISVHLQIQAVTMQDFLLVVLEAIKVTLAISLMYIHTLLNINGLNNSLFKAV